MVRRAITSSARCLVHALGNGRVEVRLDRGEDRGLDVVVGDSLLAGQRLEGRGLAELLDERRALDAERIGRRLEDVAAEEAADLAVAESRA